MSILFAIIALYIAWIWVDYFRMIDIYEKERLRDFALIFILGCASVFIVFSAEIYVFANSTFALNGNFLNDLAYCVLRIGMLEEFAKLIPFVIVYFLIGERINEPLDYLVYISIAALGFSAMENILYFNNYGADIISSRSVLATVSHMFCSSMVAYGIIRYKFHPKKKGVIGIFLFFILASFSHGFYDFLIYYKGFESFSGVALLAYFFITISLFATILNNALNNSTFFNFKEVTNSKKITTRLFLYYGVLFLVEYGFIHYEVGFKKAFEFFKANLILIGTIVIITVLRLSRFRLIKGRWFPLNIEFPFKFGRYGPKSFFTIIIKGNAFNLSYFHEYYETLFVIKPLSKQILYLKSEHRAYMEKKLFFQNNEAFYLIRVYNSSNQDDYNYLILKPKKKGTIYAEDKYPIAALMTPVDSALKDLNNIKKNELKFLEWVMLQPIKNEQLAT